MKLTLKKASDFAQIMAWKGATVKIAPSILKSGKKFRGVVVRPTPELQRKSSRELAKELYG